MEEITTHIKPHPLAETLTNHEEDRLTLSLTQKLINQFNQEGVLYCHWKSNIDLEKTFQGELDIDLLVAEQSLARATVILMDLGFKAAVSKWAANPPGILHYYGYDPDQEDLVHLHMFTRVLTGESFLKSHLLPFEEILLENRRFVNGLAVTSKEAELVLFVLRTCIKYGSLLDAVRLLKSDKKVREEAQWLKEGSDLTEVTDLLSRYCPVVSEGAFHAFLIAVLGGTSFYRKWLLSQPVRRSLRIYRKYSFAGWLTGYVRLLAGTLVKKVRKQKGSKTLVSGGTIIAIVGADATGKSTMVSETSRWLRKNFVLNTLHAGKPPSTLLTYPVNVLLALYRRARGRSRLNTNPATGAAVGKMKANTETKSANSLIFAVRAVSLAWDRRALLLRARRASANGEIVVCDRYPTNEPGMMDSPRLLEGADNKGPGKLIYNWLSRMERNLYRQIPPPDIVLRLSVSLEIAKMRNAAREISDDETYLQNRHEQAKSWFMAGTRSIHDIDTDLSLADTLLAAKQAIWSSL